MKLCSKLCVLGSVVLLRPPSRITSPSMKHNGVHGSRARYLLLNTHSVNRAPHLCGSASRRTHCQSMFSHWFRIDPTMHSSRTAVIRCFVYFQYKRRRTGQGENGLECLNVPWDWASTVEALRSHECRLMVLVIDPSLR